MLEQIPQWSWDLKQTWNNIYLKIKEWIKSYGKYPCPRSINIIEKSLGVWCANQRSKKIKGKLTGKQIKLLEKLCNWCWSKDDLWYCNFLEMKEWVFINNKIPSNGSNNLIEKTLGSWCVNQRVANIKGKLSVEKINALNTICQWYWNPKDVWKNTYLKIKEWMQLNNKKPNKGSLDPFEKSFGIWIYNQKKKKENNKLSIDQLKLLEKLDYIC